jgi:predicted small metal-binding protein
MKKFACGDVVPGCPESFVGADEADIMTQVAAHAASSHGLTDLDAELVALVQSHIH